MHFKFAHYPGNRWVVLPLMGLLAWGGMVGCAHREVGEEARVKQAFEATKSALLNHQTDALLAHLPRNIYDYLQTLNTGGAGPSDSPGVNLLLRTALEKKVPDDIRHGLTLNSLLQSIDDRKMLNLRDVQAIDIGQVTIMSNGRQATAEIHYQGALTALRLPFIKEGADWKIDLMAVLPSAELLMRLDRAIKGETQAQQVEQLVSRLPSL